MINTANNWSRTQGWFILGQTQLKAFHPQHYTTHYCPWQISLALFACCWNPKTFHTAKITSVCCHIDTNVVFVVLQLLSCSALSCVPNDLLTGPSQVNWPHTPAQGLAPRQDLSLHPHTFLGSAPTLSLKEPLQPMVMMHLQLGPSSWSQASSFNQEPLGLILLTKLMPKSCVSEAHLPGLSRCAKKFCFPC